MQLIKAPGGLTDFSEPEAQGWSDYMSNFIDRTISGYELKQFFNPTKTTIADDAVEQKIAWSAFPKKLEEESGGSNFIRWTKADDDRLRNQDEYCEWHVTKNDDGKITKVEFTSEGPEYWKYLFSQAPGKPKSGRDPSSGKPKTCW